MAESPEGTDTSEHDAFVVEQDEGDLEAMLALQADLASEKGFYVRGGQGSFDGAYHSPVAPPEGGPLSQRIARMQKWWDDNTYAGHLARVRFRNEHDFREYIRRIAPIPDPNVSEYLSPLGS